MSSTIEGSDLPSDRPNTQRSLWMISALSETPMKTFTNASRPVKISSDLNEVHHETYWPRKLLHPMIQAAIGTLSLGKTCLTTKYIPPAVGYALTSSATICYQACMHQLEIAIPEKAMQSANRDPVNHAQIAVAVPPAANGAAHEAETARDEILSLGLRRALT